MFGALKPEFWWYVSRASGIVAWILLSLAVLWGILVASRMFPVRSAPKWLLDTHRFLGALALCFTVVHLAALWADSYLQFGVRELFVPLASLYEPGAVAWGVVALYLLTAVELTSLVMRHLPRRIWRAVHLTSFAVFVLSTVHVLFAGTDVGNVVLLVTMSMLIGVTVFAVTFRVLVARRGRERPAAAVAARVGGARTRAA